MGKSPSPSASVWPSMTLERTPSRMLFTRGVSVCSATASSASSSGSEDCTSVASWRVTSDRSAGRHGPAQREGLLARGFLLGDFRHRERQELALAQQLADLARRVALDDAAGFAPAGIDRRVFECAHRRTCALRPWDALVGPGDAQDFFERGDAGRGPSSGRRRECSGRACGRGAPAHVRRSRRGSWCAARRRWSRVRRCRCGPCSRCSRHIVPGAVERRRPAPGPCPSSRHSYSDAA